MKQQKTQHIEWVRLLPKVRAQPSPLLTLPHPSPLLTPAHPSPLLTPHPYSPLTPTHLSPLLTPHLPLQLLLGFCRE